VLILLHNASLYKDGMAVNCLQCYQLINRGNSYCRYKANHQYLTYAVWLLSCTVCRDSCGRFDFLGMKIMYINVASNTIC